LKNLTGGNGGNREKPRVQRRGKSSVDHRIRIEPEDTAEKRLGEISLFS
jgi:hypothetical protein